jgi:hypothetical protein
MFFKNRGEGEHGMIVSSWQWAVGKFSIFCLLFDARWLPVVYHSPVLIMLVMVFCTALPVLFTWLTVAPHITKCDIWTIIFGFPAPLKIHWADNHLYGVVVSPKKYCLGVYKTYTSVLPA